MKIMAVKLPTGYGAAAPYAKKKPAGYGYGYGAAAYAKKKRRRRAARVLRKKKGSYRAFVKAFIKANPGKTIVDAAKAWKA